jgi:hypothetical protein
VDDLKKDFAKRLTVSNQKDKADVTVEALARGDVKPGIPTPDRDTSKQPSDSVNVTFTAGHYKINLAGHGARTAAAKDVANQVEDWIPQNRDKLTAERKKLVGK